MNWRAVPGYEGRYEVSDTGAVRNTRTGRVLKPLLMKNGYTEVKLQSDEGERRHYVHRLVATAFVPGDTSLHVNHKDGQKAHNAAGNLEWVTHAENMQHARAAGLIGPHGRQCAVRVGDQTFPSINAAARAFGRKGGAVWAAPANGRLFQGKEVQRV